MGNDADGDLPGIFQLGKFAVTIEGEAVFACEVQFPEAVIAYEAEAQMGTPDHRRESHDNAAERDSLHDAEILKTVVRLRQRAELETPAAVRTVADADHQGFEPVLDSIHLDFHWIIFQAQDS